MLRNFGFVVLSGLKFRPFDVLKLWRRNGNAVPPRHTRPPVGADLRRRVQWEPSPSKLNKVSSPHVGKVPPKKGYTQCCR